MVRLLVLLGVLSFSVAQQPILDYSRFETVEGETYVEFYLGINSGGVTYRKAEKGYEAEVQVTLKIYSLPDSQVIALLPQTITTPAIEDTSLPSFTRLQVRKKLAAGNYGAELWVWDARVKNAKQVMTKVFFYIEHVEDDFSFSDITLLDSVAVNGEKGNSFTKHGTGYFPLATDGILINQDSLKYYVELYRLNKRIDEPFYYDIYLTEGDKQQSQNKYHQVTRPKLAEDFEVFQAEMDISELKDGLFVLHIVLKNNFGDIIASIEKPFEVLNNVNLAASAESSDYDRMYGYTEEELSDIIPQLMPIASSLERDFSKSLKTFEHKKNYFVNFWRRRASQSDKEPAAMALDYLKRLTFVNQNYGNALVKGWQSQRGRVMLEYGPPNEVQRVDNDGELYPHQIWNYNSLKGQGAVFFVFADMDLTGNNLELVHSNLNTEAQNPNWRDYISRANNLRTPTYGISPNMGTDPVNPGGR